MPSFLEKEQIQPIQPFIADGNSILNTFNTKVEYWKQGVAAVKGAYQNFLNLELSHTDNQGRLDDYMKTAKKQIQQSAQTDLSLGDNQTAAMSIFNPILEDKNIMGDNSITKFYKEQYQIGESYKNKEGGKYYNSTNQNWMLRQLDRFRQDKASNWQQHWSQRDGYTPFYDVSAEKAELMKNFKPDVLDNTYQHSVPVTDKNGKVVGQQGSMYLAQKKDQSWLAPQIKMYLEGNLSDKAKKQLSIDGAMAYGDRLDVLGNDYVPYAQQSISMYNQNIERQKGRLTQIIDPAEIKNINNKIKFYQDRVLETETDIKKINAGDLSYINQNKDKFASFLYTDKYLNESANALSRADVQFVLKPDEVKLKMWEKNQDVAMNNADNMRAVKVAQIGANATITAAQISATARMMAAAKGKGKGKGNGSGDDNDVSELDYDEVSPNDINKTDQGSFFNDKSKVDSTISQADSELAALNNDLWKYAWHDGNGSFGEDYKNLSHDGRDAAIKQWLSDQGKKPLKDQDPYYSSVYMPKLQSLATKKATYETIKSNAENALAQYNPQGSRKLEATIQNAAIKYGISHEDATNLVTAYLNDGFKGATSDNSGNSIYTINGKQYKMLHYNFDKASQEGSLSHAIASIKAGDDIQGDLKEFAKKQQEIYSVNLDAVKKVSSFKDQSADALEAERKNLALAMNSTAVTDKNFGQFHADLQTGRTYVNYIPSAKDPVKIEDVQAQLQQQGYRNISVTNGVISYDSDKFKTQPGQFPVENDFQMQLIAGLNTGHSSMTPAGIYAPGGGNRHFRVQAFNNGNGIEYRPVIENPYNGKPKILNDDVYPNLTGALMRIQELSQKSDKDYQDDLIRYQIIQPNR